MRTFTIAALLLLATATSIANEGEVISIQGDTLTISVRAGSSPEVGDTVTVMNFPDASGNATALGEWRITEVRGGEVTATLVRRFGGEPSAGMEALFRSSGGPPSGWDGSVEVPGNASSGVPGKVTDVRGDVVTVRLETQAVPAVGDRVELSYTVGEDSISVGTWRVIRVGSDGRVDAEVEDARGRPTSRMDAMVFATGTKASPPPPQTPARRPEGEMQFEEALRLMAEDPSRAVRLLVEAAEMGHPEAAERAGSAYEYGAGVTQDYGRAAALYRQAAEAGRPAAQNKLGALYGRGSGVPRDQAEALRWYRRSAEQGYGWAQANLCVAYYDGHGVEKDYAEALRLCTLAADQDNPAGLDHLGWIYQQGLGVSKDLQKAASLYLRAAEQGHANGQNNIGYMYRMGWGVERNYEQAIFWFRKASDQGMAHASYNLAEMYENGLGVREDPATAVRLYQKAAREGHETARERLQELGVN